MTTADLQQYYADLLIMQYRNQPNAAAVIKALVLPAIMDQLQLGVQNAYTMSTAIGTQLDVIGKYVGASRHGFGANGPITLNDADFLLLIKLAIVRNAAGSSLYNIELLLEHYFGSLILISDSTNMQLSYSIVSTFGSSDLQSLIVTQMLLPKPMGVSISVIIIPPGGNNYFSFCTYTTPAPASTTGFNDYLFFNTNSKWITY